MGFFSDIFGGGKSAQGSERGSDIALQAYMESAPYRRTGREAIDKLRNVYITGEEDYTTSPGYDFRRSETQKAIDRAMASRGLYGSGRRGKALADYADDLAADEYEQGFNRLAALAGIGGTGVQMGQNALMNRAGYEAQAGQQRQSGYDRSSGAAINTLAGLAGMYF